MKYYRESEKWCKKLYGNRVGLKLLNFIPFLFKDTRGIKNVNVLCSITANDHKLGRRGKLFFLVYTNKLE